MKKLTTKLTLSKTTVAALDREQLAAVKGGFTYALSGGDVCKYSHVLEVGRQQCLDIIHEITLQSN